MSWRPYLPACVLLAMTSLALAVSYGNAESVTQFYLLGGLTAVAMLRPSQQGFDALLVPIIIVPILTECRLRVGGIGVSIAEIYLYVAFLAIGTLHLRRWRPLGPTAPVEPTLLRKSDLLVVAIAATVIALLPLSENPKQSLHRIRELLIPLALLPLVRRLAPSDRTIKHWHFAIIAAALLSSAICYVQFFDGGLFLVESEDLEFEILYKAREAASYLIFQWIGFEGIKGLARGLNYFPFGYSEVMFVPLGLLTAGLFWARRWRARLLWAVAIAFTLTAILLSGSRSVLLISLCGIAMIATWRIGRLRVRPLWCVVAAFPAALYLVPALSFLFTEDEVGTLIGRLDYVTAFSTYISGFPLRIVVGADIENFMARTGASQPPHHFVLFGLAYDGLIVTVLLTWLLVVVMHRTWHEINRRIGAGDDPHLVLMIGLWSGLFIRIFFYGQSAYLTWSTPHNIDLFLFLGLLVYLANPAGRPQSSTTEATSLPLTSQSHSDTMSSRAADPSAT